MEGGPIEHCGIALGQRGWKRQPDGTLRGLGISPMIGDAMRSASVDKFGDGAAAISVRV